MRESTGKYRGKRIDTGKWHRCHLKSSAISTTTPELIKDNN